METNCRAQYAAISCAAIVTAIFGFLIVSLPLNKYGCATGIQKFFVFLFMALEIGFFIAFVVFFSLQAQKAKQCAGSPFGSGCSPTQTAKVTVSAVMMGINCLPIIFGIIVSFALCIKIRRGYNLEDDDDFHDNDVEMN